ncbi:MAG TPA: hypothetical protein VMC85_14500 [Desulfomonilaceae bacterium]|nr:hypothetical protein [Desulfomonilaceae bacterium]
MFMVSGCGRYKEELESAKQQIERLNAEVKRLTEEAASLNQEKSRLSNDLKTVTDKNTRLQQELDDLNKTKAARSAENKEVMPKNRAPEQQVASPNRERSHVVEEIEGLKTGIAEEVSPAKPRSAKRAKVGPRMAKTSGKLSPCDAVVAFMEASEAIIRQQKGAERTKSLRQVKEEYTPKMKGAPEKAIKAAENWVKEYVKVWDESPADGVLRLLQLRGIVLEACGKSPDEMGFK